MQCDRCGTEVEHRDNFCRHCGNDLQPVEVTAVAQGPSYPAPVPAWRQAAPVVAQGVAMLAAGALIRYAGPRLALAAVRLPIRMIMRNGSHRSNGGSALEPLPKGTASFTEVLYVREIRGRR